MKKYVVTVNGKKYEVVVEEAAAGASFTPAAPAAPAAKAEAPKAAPAPAAAGSGKAINAPMPGTILKVCVQNGASVKKGDVLFVLEAMKMENEIMAPDDATVSSVSVREGAAVNAGDVLCTLA